MESRDKALLTLKIEEVIGRVEIRIAVSSSFNYHLLQKLEQRRQQELIMIIKDRGQTFMTMLLIILKKNGNNAIA